ncbi:MAG: AAA family ATPase [Bacteroides xylanisolvens]
MGIFSTLNQLIDIASTRNTMLLWYDPPEIKPISSRTGTVGRKERFDKRRLYGIPTRMYDGYHFNYVRKEGMYNPFSILNVLRAGC